MKKLLITVCFILAFPILFSAPRNAPHSGAAQVFACDAQFPGNCECDSNGCVTITPNHNKGSIGRNPGDANPPINVGHELGMIAFMLLLWLRMR